MLEYGILYSVRKVTKCSIQFQKWKLHFWGCRHCKHRNSSLDMKHKIQLQLNKYLNSNIICQSVLPFYQQYCLSQIYYDFIQEPAKRLMFLSQSFICTSSHNVSNYSLENMIQDYVITVKLNSQQWDFSHIRIWRS